MYYILLLNLHKGGYTMPATKIGDKVIRVDAIEKARGEATYVCDMTLPDMQ